MIFITEVWSGLCKLTTYQLLNALMSFGPTQHGPTLVYIIFTFPVNLKKSNLLLDLLFFYCSFYSLSVPCPSSPSSSLLSLHLLLFVTEHDPSDLLCSQRAVHAAGGAGGGETEERGSRAELADPGSGEDKDATETLSLGSRSISPQAGGGSDREGEEKEGSWEEAEATQGGGREGMERKGREDKEHSGGEGGHGLCFDSSE